MITGVLVYVHNIQKLIDLAGAIPFDNMEDAEAVVENFCSKNIAVVVTNRETSIKHGTHLHDSYEFVTCYSRIPSCIIDDKIYNRTSNTLFAVNPMQEHGMAVDMKGFNLCGIHIDRKSQLAYSRQFDKAAKAQYPIRN